MSDNAVICMRIDQSIKDKLKKLAKQEDRTLSNLIQRILKEHLNRG